MCARGKLCEISLPFPPLCNSHHQVCIILGSKCLYILSHLASLSTVFFFFFNVSDLFYVSWVFCSNIYLCTTWVPDAQGGQKRGLNPLGLTLWMTVSHHVCAMNQILCKNKCTETTEPFLQLLHQPLNCFLPSIFLSCVHLSFKSSYLAQDGLECAM